MTAPYRSPANWRVMAKLENKLLSADSSWWTGRRPPHSRVVAEVPRALYLNFLVKKSAVAELAPGVFRPLDLQGETDTTLFTILLFTLERARPVWAPTMAGALTPRFMQSNWRFYGDILEPPAQPRPGVLFVRTFTTSLLLSAFGRRIARCFPLRRASRMKIECQSRIVTGLIERGHGSGPALQFEGEYAEGKEIPDISGERFPSYEAYARWIIDQHLSLVIWPREHVVQDMHLDFGSAKITPLSCTYCRVEEMEDFLTEGQKPFDCFVVENLRVFLDSIHAVADGAAGLVP